MKTIEFPNLKGLFYTEQLVDLLENKIYYDLAIEDKVKEKITLLENLINEKYNRDRFWFCYEMSFYIMDRILDNEIMLDKKIDKNDKNEYIKAKNYLFKIKTLKMTPSKKIKIPNAIKIVCKFGKKYLEE